MALPYLSLSSILLCDFFPLLPEMLASERERERAKGMPGDKNYQFKILDQPICRLMQ
jgi:hypothetical protein